MNKIKTNNYLILSIISSFMVMLLVSLVVVIAITSTNNNATINFPHYDYSDYIDRSDNNFFAANAGSQLYQAESASITGNGEIVSNIGASDGLCVNNLTNYSSLSYTIVSDEDCFVELKLSLNYTDSFNRPILANNLFTLTLNRKEVSLNNIFINSSASNYDFIENNIGTISLQKGNNLLQLISTSPNYQIDYMVLTSPFERSTQLKSIGHIYYPFYYQENKQIFEAENSERHNSVIFDSSLASQGYYLLFSQNQDKSIFYINSDLDFSSVLSACVKPISINQKFAFSVYVNGNLIDNYQFIENSNGFFEQTLTRINLKSGNNIIEIIHLEGTFNFDYISLNGDINYSLVEDTQRYECEKAEIDNAAIISDINASANNSVLFYSNSILNQRLISLVDDNNYLSLRIKNLSSETELSKMMKIMVNNRILDLTYIDCPDDEKYHDIFIGSINIISGSNLIRISSVNDNFLIDCITLIKTTINDNFDSMRFEGENALLSGNCGIEYNVTASQGKNVGYIKKDSSLTFVFYSSIAIKANLIISLSNSFKENDYLKHFLQIDINSNVLPIESIVFVAGNGWKYFFGINIGNISINPGINTISIKCLNDSSYNLDYIELHHI